MLDIKNTMNEMNTAIENCKYAQYCRGEKSSKPEKKIPVMLQMNEDREMKIPMKIIRFH